MRVSVVICTYNRAEGLRETLQCLRRQAYSDMEVVVVNGPSTDHTADVLADFDGEVKVVDNPFANLSISRNLGIRAAAGDVVAFIDDDALPELNWLDQAIPAFDDPEVGGVGGIVLDHTGMNLQYRYSAATRFGDPVFADEVGFDRFCVPGSFTFPYLQGTNALFRRDVLERVGLFDEVFDFYLDETDLCCRIVDAGYRLRQLDDAAVHHKYLPSGLRNTERVTTNWYPVVKNHTYFAHRHALGPKNELEIIDNVRALIDRLLTDSRGHEQAGRLPDGHTQAATAICGDAMAEGMRLGLERRGLRLPPVVLDPDPFLPYPRPSASGRRNIVLVSSGYTPNLTGGIARFISDAAPELAALGHDVRVFTRADGPSTIDLEDGVWVHRLAPAPVPGRVPEATAHVDGFASAVADELERISAWWRADIAYGSLWDVELLGIARAGTAPVVPMLATPVGEVAVHEGWDDPASPSYDDVSALIELEKELVRESIAVHAISDAILDTFDRLYDGVLDEGHAIVSHIGRADDVGERANVEPRTPPMVLFVGRLEPRKGIDVFLDAAATLLDRHGRDGRGIEIVVAGNDERPRPDGTRWPAWWRRRHPGERRVEFVGAVDDDRLAELTDEASVVVMPSRYESFGLVAVEAMMHSRPPVASAVGGIEELITDGETGRLVPVADARALADAISDLLNDPDAATEMGRRARQHFLDHLAAPAATARLDAVLERALDRRLAPVP